MNEYLQSCTIVQLSCVCTRANDSNLRTLNILCKQSADISVTNTVLAYVCACVCSGSVCVCQTVCLCQTANADDCLNVCTCMTVRSWPRMRVNVCTCHARLVVNARTVPGMCAHPEKHAITALVLFSLLVLSR